MQSEIPTGNTDSNSYSKAVPPRLLHNVEGSSREVPFDCFLEHRFLFMAW